jgi:hypothetical protein
MNYSQEAISLHGAVRLAMDLENEALVSPVEYEGSVAFKRSVLRVLRSHDITAADLNKSIVGEGTVTLLRFLRRSPEVPFNVLVVLRDWTSRYNATGYDYVAAWAEQQDFQGC